MLITSNNPGSEIKSFRCSDYTSRAGFSWTLLGFCQGRTLRIGAWRPCNLITIREVVCCLLTWALGNWHLKIVTSFFLEEPNSTNYLRGCWEHCLVLFGSYFFVVEHQFQFLQYISGVNPPLLRLWSDSMSFSLDIVHRWLDPCVV